MADYIQVAQPTRVEKHIVGCALCGKTARYNDARTASTEWQNHMRREHNKFNAYVGDAGCSVIILFEGNDPNQELQDVSHRDPLNQFLLTRDWMNERGLLIPKVRDVPDS